MGPLLGHFLQIVSYHFMKHVGLTTVPVILSPLIIVAMLIVFLLFCSPNHILYFLIVNIPKFIYF